MVPNIANVMGMIGDRLDVIIQVGIEMLSSLPLVACSLDHVKQVGNDAGSNKSLAVLIEIDSPGVTAAPRKDVELMPRGMLTPDGRIERCALVVWCSRFTDTRMGEDAMAPV